MAFKLPSKKINTLKSKGLLNKSPFKANGNTMAYNNGEPTTSKPVEPTTSKPVEPTTSKPVEPTTSKPVEKAINEVARPAYDPDSVKANKEVRTKEFNETSEGKKMADIVNLLSGKMRIQSPQTSGPNKGKFYYTDESKEPGYQTVYFSKDDYKKAADNYAEAKYDFSLPRNEAMKKEHGDVASFTDSGDKRVQNYGESYEMHGGNAFENVGKAKVEVDRPNPSNNIVNKE